MKPLTVTCVAVVAQEEDILSQVRLADMWKVVEVFSKLDRVRASVKQPSI